MTDDFVATRDPGRGLASPWSAALGLTWLALPALQYVGTYQRTLAVANLQVPGGGLAALDLTPWYVALVGATAAYALLRALADRGNAHASSEPAP